MSEDFRMSIMDAVHDTAAGLHSLGFIDKRKMNHYDLLCGEELPEYDSTRIKSIRHKLNLSQTVLAASLNMSPSTVRQWEQGLKHPSGAAQKLLFLLESRGLDILL
ncbi:MAG: helix-turn-helix domain-containing protein [Thiomicrorhabdus sp.]|jgi:putative transcriptional regulator|nr:helix-turn-helix domain-containing protein [Thiomicrorhabdus sp.]